MLAAADNDRYTAVFSCIVFVYAVQDNGMNIQQHTFRDRLFLLGYVLDKINGLFMVDSFQMLLQPFACNGNTFVDHHIRFMEGQGISLDAVAVIGIFNLQGLCDAVILISPVLIQFT